MKYARVILWQTWDDGTKSILDLFEIGRHNSRTDWTHWYREFRALSSTKGLSLEIQPNADKTYREMTPAESARYFYEKVQQAEKDYWTFIENHKADRAWEKHWDEEAEMKRATASESTVPAI
jgi:hypothetical protein